MEFIRSDRSVTLALKRLEEKFEEEQVRAEAHLEASDGLFQASDLEGVRRRRKTLDLSTKKRSCKYC